MTPNAKRMVTEEKRVTSIALDNQPQTSTPPDLAARLRGVGARVRKSVAEGYVTSPSSHALFAKSSSTGDVFRSANDILRDIYSNPSALSGNSGSVPIPPKKRARSNSDHDTRRDANEENHASNKEGEEPLTSDSTRRFKPLRKQGIKFTESRSLPPGSFSFSTPAENQDVDMSTGNTEDDWSLSSPYNIKFEPMAL